MQISNGIASGGKPTMSERITDMADKLSTPAAYTASATTFGVGIINWNMVAIIVGILGTILNSCNELVLWAPAFRYGRARASGSHEAIRDGK